MVIKIINEDKVRIPVIKSDRDNVTYRDINTGDDKNIRKSINFPPHYGKDVLLQLSKLFKHSDIDADTLAEISNLTEDKLSTYSEDDMQDLCERVMVLTDRLSSNAQYIEDKAVDMLKSYWRASFKYDDDKDENYLV